MAEINLLQNQEVEVKERLKSSVLNKIGIVLLVLVLAGYAAAYYFDAAASAQISTDKGQQSQVQQLIQQDQNYPALVSNQEKLTNLKILLDKHLSWGDLIKRFADATLKSATYTKFQANSEGGATITGTVPDFQSLDKLIKAYQLNDFNYIKDVKLINIGLSDKSQNGIQFTIKVTFNKDLLQPK